jgi:hypothetical protein
MLLRRFPAFALIQRIEKQILTRSHEEHEEKQIYNDALKKSLNPKQIVQTPALKI